MIRFLLCIAVASILGACDADDPQDQTSTQTAQEVDTLYPVLQDGRWGYIDQAGNLAIEPRFDRAWRFSGGVALVSEGGDFGYIRPDGSYVLEPQFDDAWHFADGLAPVELDGEWSYVDTSGSVMPDTQINLTTSALIETTYDDGAFDLMHAGGEYGYSAGEGRAAIEPQYDKAWRFSDGLARVKTGGKWGYINKEGEFVIEPRFDRAWEFTRGLAMVQAGDTVGYINREGRYVWPQSR